MSYSTKTKNLKKTPQTLDVDLFEQQLDNGDAGLALLNHSLRTAIDAEPVLDVLKYLLSDDRKANLFECTLSVVDDDLASILRDELLASLEFKKYSSSLPSLSALERLAKLFLFISTGSSFGTGLHFVQSSQEILLYFKDANDRGLVTLAQGINQDEASPNPTKKKRSQRQAKNNKQSLGIDQKIKNLLRGLKETVPSTESEIEELITLLLVQQKELLVRFIDLLRDPFYSDMIRHQYMTTNVREDVLISEQPTDVEQESLSPQRQCLSDSKLAYPSVQPIKVSLFFDSAEGLGEWRIFISTTAIADLRSRRKNRDTFELILRKLRELSNGFFSHDNRKRLTDPNGGIPIFEAKVTSDLRLIYQIDLFSDFESQCESQAVRFYGIFPLEKVDGHMWKMLSAQLATRGKEYRRRIVNVFQNDALSPKSWPDPCGMEDRTQNTISSSSAESLQSVHRWLILEKYSPFSQELLNSIMDKKESSPVFSVSSYERDIIEHPSACYVIGRSGTGKTTTMVFKMLGIERSAQNSVKVGARPRQLFVTQSRVLAREVRDYYTKLAFFLSASTESCRSTSGKSSRTETDGGLVYSDDDNEGLPKRFGELRDEHFPLFLTFDKLCKLLGMDLNISFTRPSFVKEHKRHKNRLKVANVTEALDEIDSQTGDLLGTLHANTVSSNKLLVTFESFCNKYWEHFPQKLTTGLDPALVFSEFLGIIEGSEKSLRSPKQFLSKEDYLSLSERTRPSQREKIYDIFEKYMAMKGHYGDYDAADRSHAIIRRMEEGYNGYVDYLYVDEAQDNLIIDAILLRRLCRNPHGLFWAGDTAQTIAVGSSFRFNELKATLHRFERRLFPSTSERIIEPASYQLTKNFRSHSGIVNCAEAIVDIIKFFWPHSIDDLQKEIGVVDGPKPIFFVGRNDETVRYEQFLLGERGLSIEFGAKQCILVRNNKARRELRKEVGKDGIILTLYESKGLEFDDVLLYNFFKDSPSDVSHWRIVLNFLRVEGGNNGAVPTFDEVRHAGICTEVPVTHYTIAPIQNINELARLQLKFLYVAMTRARKNIWFIDQSHKGEPLKTVLIGLKRMTTCTTDNTPQLRVASDLAFDQREWARRGKELFENENYSQAAYCYNRAARPVEHSVAKAFDLRHRAMNTFGRKNVQIRYNAFLDAASAFFCCAKVPCMSLKDQKYLYRISAECFLEAQDDGQAALSYRNAEEYGKAAALYLRANVFDKAVEIVQTETVNHNIVESVIGASRLHYVHAGEIDKALKLFASEDDCLKYMEKYGFDDTRASLLQKKGRIHEAAEILSRGGRFKEAMRTLLPDSQNPKSVRLAAGYLIKCLWDQYSFGVDLNQNDASAMDLLLLGQELNKTLVDSKITEELDMFDVISRGDKHALLSVYKKRLVAGNNRPAIVLILDHLLRGSGHLFEDPQSVVDFLQASLTYAEILGEIWWHPNLISKPGIQNLFAFRQLSKEFFLLTNGSLLATCASKRQDSLRSVTSGSIVGRHNLLRLLRSSISMRLWGMVQTQLDMCGNIRVKLFGDPRLSYSLERRFSESDCCQQRIDIGSGDFSWFNVRVRVHVLEILFLHAADFALPDSETRAKYRTEWLTYFVNAINPPVLSLASIASISRDKIPELDEGMDVVALWVESRAFHFHPSRLDRQHVLNSTMEIAILASYQDRSKIRAEILRLHCFSDKEIHSANECTIYRSRISELVQSLDFSNVDFINSGTLFVKNVIKYRLDIDIGYLCRLIEILSASSVILHANRSWKGFRDCLLPKSWLSFLLPRLNLARGYNVRNPMWSLVQIMADLARRLRSSSDQELSFLRGTTDRIVSNLAIQRICRAMCLVSYNATRELRDAVVQTFADLRSVGNGPLPAFLMPYLRCSCWADLRHAAETSVPSSALDELVQLVQDGYTPTPFITNARISRVIFKNREELSAIFASADRIDSFKMSSSVTTYAPRLVASRDTSGNSDGQNEVAGDKSTATVEGKEATENGDREDEQGTSFNGTVTIEIPSRKKNAARVILRCLDSLRMKRRIHAARVIQRSYKAWKAYRHEMEKPGVRGKWMKFCDACSDIDRKQQWSSNHRRFVYLGIIPHLLVCLDALHDQNRDQKEKAKRKLRPNSKAGKVDYEEVNRRLTEANNNLKRIDLLKNQLDAKSEWHLKRSLEDLKEVVVQISDLLKDSKTAGVQDDIALAIKAIVQERRVRRQTAAKSKPSLNVEDWDEMY